MLANRKQGVLISMRRLLAFTLSIVLLGLAAGCAAQPAPTATPTPSVVSAQPSATTTKHWTTEEAVNQYLKTENGVTTLKVDAIKADFSQFQVVSADNSFNLKIVGYEKIAPLLDKLATVQMTEGDINKLSQSPNSVWNLQSFTKNGKLNGDSVTIFASTPTQIDLYILVGDTSLRKVFTISDADGAALKALAQEQAKVANAPQQ